MIRLALESLRHLRSLTSVLLALAVVVDPASAFQSPAQPTALAASHRDGQTFLTWTASSDSAVLWYQVYRHDQPITAANLASATPIWRVTEGSSLFMADRYFQSGSNTWSARYFSRYVIDDLGAELGATDELLVWTIAEEDVGTSGSGNGYYAVTSVLDDGTENTSDFTLGNTLGPVAESIAPPRAIIGRELTSTGGYALIQYLDLRSVNVTLAAPNSINSHYGLDPLDPKVEFGQAYAYTYAMFPPDVGGCAPAGGTYPVVLNLHGHGGIGLRPYTTFEPHPDWCTAYRIYAIDPVDTWWFGAAEDNDYRTSSVPQVGDTIRNFTEQRILRMVDDLIDQPIAGAPVDTNRIYVTGHSMGGTGTLALSLRYPQVFAASYASQPMTKPSTAGDAGGTDWESDLEIYYGAQADALSYVVDVDAPYQAPLAAFSGITPWDWQDHQVTLSQRTDRDYVPLGIDHGLLDDIIEWQTQGQPVYAELDQAAICFSGEVTNTVHVTSNQSGLMMTLQKVSGRPFSDFTAIRDETVPGFVGATTNSTLPPTNVGEFNTSFEWSASWDNWDVLPEDTADRWAVSVRTMGTLADVELAPRRMQVFDPQPGDVLRWENVSLAGGGATTSGTLVVPADGVPLTPPTEVSTAGNRIAFERTLTGDVDQISLAAGGAQVLQLRCGADLAGSVYILLGSFSGTTPGIPMADGTVLPLASVNPVTFTPDAYFFGTLTSPNQSYLTPSFGVLDGDGEAACTLSIPGGVLTSLAGQTLNHAFAIVDPFTLQGKWASSAVAVDLVP